MRETKSNGESGFTLIELMIAIMIVGLLATVATPMLTRSLEKAKSSEAMTAMGSIRRAMRMHYVEHGTYRDPAFLSGRKVTFGEILALTDTDLEGRYFSSDCYTFERVKRRTFRIRCDGSSSTAPAGDDVVDVTLFVNQRGDIWSSVSADDGPLLHLAIPILDRD